MRKNESSRIIRLASSGQSHAKDGLLTLDEFERLPEEDEHGWLAGKMILEIGTLARDHGLGLTLTETGFLLADDPPTVRGPDAAFIARENVPATGPPVGFWSIPPDLAVEIVSPSNSSAEIEDKVHEYLAAGSRVVWVVDPGLRGVTVYRSRDDIDELREGDTRQRAPGDS